jgi:hypothetical protein
MWMCTLLCLEFDSCWQQVTSVPVFCAACLNVHIHWCNAHIRKNAWLYTTHTLQSGCVHQCGCAHSEHIMGQCVHRVTQMRDVRNANVSSQMCTSGYDVHNPNVDVYISQPCIV